MKLTSYAVLFGLLAVDVRTNTDKVVCYYGNWAGYRSGNGACNIEDLEPGICTHIIYSFLGIDASTNKVKSLDTWMDFDKGGLTRFIGLRAKNPNAKLMVAVGGFNEGTAKFSAMASTSAKRKVFIDSLFQFLTQYNFDGADIDWEFPAASDKQNFGFLIQEAKATFGSKILSAAISAVPSVMDNAYNVASLNNLDFINIMCYDYHGGWDRTAANHAPLFVRTDEGYPDSTFNLKYTLDYLVSHGAILAKLIVGIPMYGRTFTLASASSHGYHAPTIDVGNAGPYTVEAGFLGYNEWCESNKSSPWTLAFDSESQSPYAYRGNQWIGFDTVDSVKNKVNWIKSNNYGGGMVWSLETDDVHNYCGGGTFPLTRTIYTTIFDGSSAPAPAPAPSPSTTTTTTAPATTTTKATTTKAPTTTTNSAPTTTTTRAPTPSGSCTGSYGRSADCAQFYQCVNGTPGPSQNCPSGLLFSLDSNACDWPANVVC